MYPQPFSSRSDLLFCSLFSQDDANSLQDFLRNSGLVIQWTLPGQNTYRPDKEALPLIKTQTEAFS